MTLAYVISITSPSWVAFFAFLLLTLATDLDATNKNKNKTTAVESLAKVRVFFLLLLLPWVGWWCSPWELLSRAE